MKKNIFLLLVIIVVNSFSSRIDAQDTSFITATVQWDLPTAIAYAKQNNIQVNIIKLDERLSEQDLLLAGRPGILIYRVRQHNLSPTAAIQTR